MQKYPQSKYTQKQDTIHMNTNANILQASKQESDSSRYNDDTQKGRQDKTRQDRAFFLFVCKRFKYLFTLNDAIHS